VGDRNITLACKRRRIWVEWERTARWGINRIAEEEGELFT